MWIADQWKDYEVLDTSGGEKLERWGDYLLVRPDPQVIWNTPKDLPGWRKMNGHYYRSSKGGGEWEFFDLPKQWEIAYKDLRFNLKPFSFKHTGLFPEQAVNWDWFSDKIKNAGRPVKVLNLFAYTGGATLAAAAAGASVTHVDASKGMVNWARENAKSSGLEAAPIRWLVDDCMKFVERDPPRKSLRRHHHGPALLRKRTERRDLEDRGFHLRFHQTLHPDPQRRPAVLPGQFLHHRAGSRGADLHALHGAETFRRPCGFPGNRPAGDKDRSGVALRSLRTLGKIKR